jgi:hypothetical protein
MWDGIRAPINPTILAVFLLFSTEMLRRITEVKIRVQRARLCSTPPG